MNPFVTAWQWWLQSCLSTSVVLFCAVTAAVVVRQPARRKRIMELALVVCLAAIVLAAVPQVPRWSLVDALNDSAAARDAALVRRQAVESVESDAQIDESSETAEHFVKHLADTPENAELLAALQEIDESLPQSGLPADTAAQSLGLLSIQAAVGIVALALHVVVELMLNLYMLGVVAMSLWWLCGLAAVWRVVRQSRPATDDVQSVLAQIVAASPWPARRGKVRVLMNDRVAQPFTFTWFTPNIVLPASLAQGDVQPLRWSLAHEWAHVAAGDARWWSFSGLLRIVLFYQPLIYVLRRELRQSQDYLADAAAKGEAEAVDYAEFLTRCVARMAAPVAATPVLGIGGRRCELRRRVTMLVSPRRPLELRCPRRWSIGAALLAAGLAALAVTVTSSQQPAQAIEPLVVEQPMPSAAAEEPRDTSSEPQSVRAGRDWLLKQQAAETAVQKGLRYLQASQQPDGSWTDVPGNEGGVTALVAMALVAANVPADDPQLQLALVRVRGIEPKSTYLVSLQTMALCAARRELADMSPIERNVAWLEKNQNHDETGAGGWSYQGDGRRIDGSNTFYALLALDAAARAGAAVKPATWQVAADYFLAQQHSSGGWPYTQAAPPTASMTAAGVASLSIAARHCAKNNASDEARARQLAAVEKGIAWLAKNWSDVSPTKVKTWQFYYLHTLVAAGNESRHASFGDKSWSHEGLDLLLAHQSAAGSWSGAASEQNPALATSLALLFIQQSQSTASQLSAAAAKRYTIDPLSVIHIHAEGTLPGRDIRGDFIVEPGGEVSLGPAYGRVVVRGLTYSEAEQVIEKQLKKTCPDAKVAVTLGGWKTSRSTNASEKVAKIAPLDTIRIEVDGTLVGQLIRGDYKVEPGGEVALGPAYGRVQVAGLGFREAEEAISKHLRKILKSPEVSVTMGGWPRDLPEDPRVQRLENELRHLKSTVEELQREKDKDDPRSEQLRR